MSLSYHHLCLADGVRQRRSGAPRLALPVLPVPLRHGSELVKRLVAIEPIPDLLILNQPIDPLKVLLLGQIDLVDLGGLHLPLQHLRVKKNYICMST
jgi:hypothetical protein